jgi:hypothetical protein
MDERFRAAAFAIALLAVFSSLHNSLLAVPKLPNSTTSVITFPSKSKTVVQSAQTRIMVSAALRSVSSGY